MSADSHAPLRKDVRQLGGMLGNVLRQSGGKGLFQAVEQFRRLSKKARGSEGSARGKMTERMAALDSEDALQLSRAFSHFLTLANVAEQHHRIRRGRQYQKRGHGSGQTGSCMDTLARLSAAGIPPDRILEAAAALRVELVFTAHPTEIARRSLLQKYNRIDSALGVQDRAGLTAFEQGEVQTGLQREITAIWHTDEIRRGKPTPQKEARGGLLIFEQTLWSELPRFLRRWDEALRHHTGQGLSRGQAPMRFGSWMGGDRDGNPHVTPEVTREVCLTSRWMAASLYLREVESLYGELSMADCSEELRRVAGGDPAPYRAVLRPVRERLSQTLAWLNAQLEGRTAPGEGVYESARELEEPLSLCYRSLRESGLDIVADGRLLDLLRRLAAFGVTLVRLDIRQEAGRHTEALDALTRYLGLGAYREWGEEERQAFLLRELREKRPLIPPDFPAEQSVKDVLDTFSLLATLPPESLGAYVISMAKAPSDVLAVELLQHASQIAHPLRVVPLLETMEALEGAGGIMRNLLSLPWYLERIGGRQEVMVGYSDSTKEAGRFASAWTLYKAQEEVVRVCRAFHVHPVFFHGRGGTVGRGGGPTRQAILSLPPGSVAGSLRLTEQGEMIQASFGTPGLALRNLEISAMASLEATLLPSPPAEAPWRGLMDSLAAASGSSYREFLAREGFVEFFRSVTPERELGLLHVGSRPSRRVADGGLETLRAIPWVFAWTQVRLMLPAWLGIGEALDQAFAEGHGEMLRALYRDWTFFQTTVDLVEMVLAKADAAIFRRYNETLVPVELRPLGEEMVRRLERTIALILEITGKECLLQDNSMLRRSIEVRNPYVDPINLMQVELLQRFRAGDDSPVTRDALLVTINGIAAGMRNTG